MTKFWEVFSPYKKLIIQLLYFLFYSMAEQSQDQAQETKVEEQSQDQAQTEESGEGNEPRMVEVDGEMVSEDELKKGYMRQKDYTHKTQKLAQAKTKSLDELKELDPELYDRVVKPLRDAGVATKEDISEQVQEAFARVESQKKAESFFEENPDLEKSKKAILDLSKNNGMTPEEVAIHYWFMDSDKSQKKRDVKGKFAPKERTYTELSPAERKAFLNSTVVKPNNAFYS